MKIDAWRCDCDCGDVYTDKLEYISHLKEMAEERLAYKKAVKLAKILRGASKRYSERTDVTLAEAFRLFIHDFDLQIYEYECLEGFGELPFKRDKYGSKEIPLVNIEYDYLVASRATCEGLSDDILSVMLRHNGHRGVMISHYWGDGYEMDTHSFSIRDIRRFRNFESLMGFSSDHTITPDSHWYGLGDELRALRDSRYQEHKLEQDYLNNIANLKGELFVREKFVFGVSPEEMTSMGYWGNKCQL